ncbi:MlaD family protein [Muricoccus radiodurans]|uniref:MlaD family protein n=1 Tax=Muricoccus radiodurans TaxID=2231721 RepID=UPI003CE7F750
MAVSARGLYLRVGILLIVGIGLGLAFVLFFTSSKLSSNARQFETYLRESVTGLAVGAAVRFRGVQLGSVTEITLVAAEYPPPENTPIQETAYRRVLVRFGMDLSRFRDLPNVETAVQGGLRARLATQGITGVSYIELDFVDATRFPPEPTPWQPHAEVIPSAPSTVSQVTSVAEQLAQRLADAPIEAILRDAAGLLADLRSQLNDGDVARASREASETLATLRQTIEGLNLPALSSELRGTVAEARGLLTAPEIRNTLRSTDAAAQQLRTALTRLPAAVGQVEQAARAVSLAVGDINGDLTPTLRDLRATSSNLRDTTELLRRAPGAAILAPPPPAPAWATERRR